MERDGSEHEYKIGEYPLEYPSTLEEKVKRLDHFRSFMSKDGQAFPTRDRDEMTGLPVVNKWFRTLRAVVMHLTNGTLQVFFFLLILQFFTVY